MKTLNYEIRDHGTLVVFGGTDLNNILLMATLTVLGTNISSLHILIKPLSNPRR